MGHVFGYIHWAARMRNSEHGCEENADTEERVTPDQPLDVQNCEVHPDREGLRTLLCPSPMVAYLCRECRVDSLHAWQRDYRERISE